ncbi:MAG: RimK family alpha-L-glutamate ligase [Pirellulaceae bacterium]|nr:RimK family alpha-L-glutamate ligase [Pirellulaceae bacterium]
MQRLGILGSPQGPYVRQLIEAAQRRWPGLDVYLLSFADLTVSLIDQRLSVSSLNWQVGHDQPEPTRVDLLALDGLIVRTMPVGSLEQVIFRMDALQAVERAGIPILNPPRALEIAIDKWLTLERLARLGLPTPATIACQTRDEALMAFERLGGDVVVKPLFGGEGRGIVRINDSDMAWRVFSTLSQLGSVLYVQQFMPHFGYDIRVLKIGQHWLSVKRRAQGDNWRTNVSLGSQAEPHTLTDQQRRLAEAAAEATGGSLLGIDLLPTRSGQTVILEVNAVPGWRGTASALKVDVAELVVEHLEELHAQRS